MVSKSDHSKPCHTDHDIKPPLLSSRVLVCPHAVAVDIPECPGGRVHSALASVVLRSLGCGGLVDHALLHDSAVHGETVGRWLGGVGRGGCGDERFEDSVLRDN